MIENILVKLQLPCIKKRLSDEKEKYMKKVSIFILLIISGMNLFPQGTYIQKINRPASSPKISMIPTTDQSVTIWDADNLELYKFDNCGNHLWGRQFSFTNFKSSCIENEMINTKKGGFAFISRETTGSTTSSRVTVLNSMGNTIWSKTYGVNSYDLCSYSLMEDASGNLFIFCGMQPIGGGSAFNLIYKLTENGTQVWSKRYDHGGIWGEAIVTSDNGVLFRTGSLFTKINSAGNVQWSCRNWRPNSYYYYAPVEVSDGYIFTSINNTTSLTNFHKIDKSGNQLWNGIKTLNFIGTTRQLSKKSNGNFVVVFNRSEGNKTIPTIIEFDKELNIVSSNAIQISSTNQTATAYDIDFTNNQPVLTGIIDSLGTVNPFFAKLNINYQSGCDTSLFTSITTDSSPHAFESSNSQTVNLTESSPVFNTTLFSTTSSTICSSSTYSIDLGNDTTICPSTNLLLKNLTNNTSSSFLWSTGATTSSISVSDSGIYWLEATEACTGVTIRDSIHISILSFPDPINFQEDTFLCLNNVILLDANHPGSIYTWQDGSNSSTFEVTTPGNYFVDISYQGCTQRFFSDVTGCEEFFIPNVFTPNNDGFNDVFQIIYNGDQTYHLSIYNRWGQLVFENNDKNEYWGGKISQKAAKEGTYYYVFSLGDHSYKGFVNLFR